MSIFEILKKERQDFLKEGLVMPLMRNYFNDNDNEIQTTIRSIWFEICNSERIFLN